MPREGLGHHDPSMERFGEPQEEYMVPIFKTNKATNKIQFDRFDYITKQVDSYDIHSTFDLKSPALKGRSEGDLVYVPYIPVHFGPENIQPHKTALAGRLEAKG